MPKAILLLPLLFLSCLSNPTKNKPEVPSSFFWEIKDSLTNASFRGISVPDEHTIWISGSGGTVMRSVNGGKTWRVNSIEAYENTDFRDVEAFDSSTAIVMGIGNPAVILKTEDGGNTWNRVFFKRLEGIFLNSMAFWDEKNGFVVGDPVHGRFYLLKTNDGGDTWEELPETSRPVAKEGEYMFAASGNCISGVNPSDLWFVSGGSTARVFHSESMGNHWEIIETNFMSGQASTGLFSVLFTDNKKGYCIGGDYSKPDSTGITFIYTLDGGISWQHPVHNTVGYRSCIKMLKLQGNQVLIAVGRGGSSFLKLSELSRGAWKMISDHGFYTLDTDPSGSVAWAAGSDGRVARLRIHKN
jgi:photosystem II stability/assembly factor-like uncharacterized protein